MPTATHVRAKIHAKEHSRRPGVRPGSSTHAPPPRRKKMTAPRAKREIREAASSFHLAGDDLQACLSDSRDLGKRARRTKPQYSLPEFGPEHVGLIVLNSWLSGELDDARFESQYGGHVHGCERCGSAFAGYARERKLRIGPSLPR